MSENQASPDFGHLVYLKRVKGLFINGILQEGGEGLPHYCDTVYKVVSNIGDVRKSENRI